MSLHHVKKFAALSLAKNVPTFALVVNFGGSSWFEIISHNRVATLHATIPVCKIVKISSGANFSGARSISNHSAISSWNEFSLVRSIKFLIGAYLHGNQCLLLEFIDQTEDFVISIHINHLECSDCPMMTHHMSGRWWRFSVRLRISLKLILN